MAFIRFLFIISMISLLNIGSIYAEETEQFTLPPHDLRDIGPITSERLYEMIAKVVQQTNCKIQNFSPKAKKSHYAAAQLKKLQRGDYLANLVFMHTGPGYPRWLRGIYANEPHNIWQYKEILPWKHAYWLVFTQNFVSFIGLSPTINMYGYYFGMDKLGHFFMQGHNYYLVYNFFINHGQTPEQAHNNMILYAQIVEQTYLGTLINGVYSNADLAVNYAGWKFYDNLTKPVKIGDHINPPILIFKDNQWQFADYINKNTLLKPYISDHWNEALNPCRYTFMRSRIRSQIIKRCPAWLTRRHITPEFIEEKLKETKTWYNEEYGYWLPEGQALTLGVCFKEPSIAP